MLRFRSLAIALVVVAGLLVPAATAGGAELGAVPTSPGLAEELNRLDAGVVHGAFVHFDGGTPAAHRALLEGRGLEITHDFESTANAVYAVGTVAALRSLTHETGAVTYMEEDRVLSYHGDTAPWATRARVAQEAVSGGPFFDGAGRILDGSGVGVAIVDSGIYAGHPDLSTPVAQNYKIVCSTPGLINTQTRQCFGPMEFVDVGDTTSDTTSGHGTHVAGIVAGDGTASTGAYASSAAPNIRGTFTGVAPGATLYGFGTGEVIAVLYATEAFQYIYDHYDEFDPRIRVINNSWGDPAGSQYDPNSVISKLVQALVGKGVTFMFSAGNSGSGSGAPGTADRTSSYCKDPTPGVVCVANYDDTFTPGAAAGHGNRNGALNSSSSRGLAGNPTTYPDISAPGTFYTASCVREIQPVCNIGIVDEARWTPWYGSISGTSMASPATAGAAALLLQARADLTPDQVEDALQDTAHKFAFGGAYEADPQNPDGTTSFDKGAGLVDVPAALLSLGVAHAGLDVTTGTPEIAIENPADGSTVSTASVTVSGTASDGAGGAQSVQPIADGDEGDYAGPGAADIVRVSAQETAGGMTYRITVSDAADVGPTGSVGLRVTQNVNGRPFTTNVNLTSSGAAPGTGTALATSASLDGNTVSFFVPYANLGDPPAGSPAHNVFASAFIGVIQDMAPSPAPGAGADVIVRPMFGRPYTIARTDSIPAKAATVVVTLDGKKKGQTATLTGTSPSYTWSTTFKLSKLPNGPHSFKATLSLGGVAVASDTVNFTLSR